MFGDRSYTQPTLKSAIEYLAYADSQINPVFIYKFGFKVYFKLVYVI